MYNQIFLLISGDQQSDMGDFNWVIKTGPYNRCGPDLAIRLTIDVHAFQKHYSITNKHQAGPKFAFTFMYIIMIAKNIC